jgi:hypothetical protein
MKMAVTQLAALAEYAGRTIALGVLTALLNRVEHKR